jgi:hypothetical protein
MALAQDKKDDYAKEAERLALKEQDKEHEEKYHKILITAIIDLSNPGKRHEAAKVLLNELGCIQGCREFNITSVPLKDRILHRDIGLKLSEAQASLREIVIAYDTLKEKEMGFLVKGHKGEEEYWNTQTSLAEETLAFWNNPVEIEKLQKKIHEVLDSELKKKV